jgi:GDP-L-fucose synthase
MRVFVTGHRGLVGSAVCRRLRAAGIEVLTAGHVDLTDINASNFLGDLWADAPPDAMVMCAARVGGIRDNSVFGSCYLRDNLKIQETCFDYAINEDIERVIFLGSVCVYPRDAPRPIREDALLTGPFEPTNEPYALAKTVGIKMVNLLPGLALGLDRGRLRRLERRSGRSRWVSLMPSNLYGLGDNFNLSSAHALPALLHKAMNIMLEIRRDPLSQKSLEVWGRSDTYREQTYVDDLAEAIWLMLNQTSFEYNVYNVGSGDGASIGTLAQMILKMTGLYDTQIVFDDTKPAGAPERILDSSRIRALGWAPKTSLLHGLEKTWEWMLANHSELRL